MAVAVTLPAFGVVYAFVRLWGGLSPPAFQEDAQGLNPAAPAFIMAQVGLFSLFFAGWLIGPARELVTKRRSALLVAVGAGLVIALVPATSYSVDAGRFSGLWNAARDTPLVFGRVSPLIVVLAIGGVVASAAWFLALPLRSRWIALAALIAFIAAQTASHNCWQRYHEPFILILMAVLTRDLDPHDAPSPPLSPPSSPSSQPSSVLRAGPRLGRFTRVAGPLTLALLLALVTIITLANANPVRPLGEAGRSDGATERRSDGGSERRDEDTERRRGEVQRWVSSLS